MFGARTTSSTLTIWRNAHKVMRRNAIRAINSAAVGARKDLRVELRGISLSPATVVSKHANYKPATVRKLRAIVFVSSGYSPPKDDAVAGVIQRRQTKVRRNRRDSSGRREYGVFRLPATGKVWDNRLAISPKGAKKPQKYSAAHPQSYASLITKTKYNSIVFRHASGITAHIGRLAT